MEKKRLPLFVPILWCITALLWLIVLIMDVAQGSPNEGLSLLRAFAFVGSLIAAIANIMRYRSGKKQ